MAIEGGCHCGAVRYAIGSVQQSMICHCRSCRRISGSPVTAWITVAPADFSLREGAPKRYQSSPGVDRSFCEGCGTQLTYARRDDDTYIDITTASLDDPSAFPPSHHSWLSDNIAWVKFGDELPAFPRSRTDGAD